jgi:hypothetical protein
MSASVNQWYVIASHRDVYFRLLSDPVKRRVVYHLVNETNGHATVDELVDRLLEADTDHDPDSAMTQRQLATELHHVHLPALAAHDVVAFDPDADAVTTRDTDAIASVLESLW